MKPRRLYTLFFIMMILVSFLIKIHANPIEKIRKEKKIKYTPKKSEENKVRNLQDENYISFTLSQSDTLGTEWKTDLNSKIEKITIDDQNADDSRLQQEITSSQTIKIYFNTPLQSLSYFLTYNSNGYSLDFDVYDQNNERTIKTYIKTMDLSHLVTSSLTSIAKAFFAYLELESVNFGNFDTSHVENMMGIFYQCPKLKSVDLSSFTTTSTTDMQYMFFYCSQLTSVNLANFDTSLVTSMFVMFAYCENLKVIDISNFDTTSIENGGVDSMFSNCQNLEILDISDMLLIKICNGNSVFDGASNLNMKYFRINPVKGYTDEELSNLGEHYTNVISFNWPFSTDNLLVCQDKQYIQSNNILEICCSFNIETNMCESNNYIIINYASETTYSNGFVNDYRNNKLFIKKMVHFNLVKRI